MADVVILSSKHSSLLIAKTPKARLHFDLQYQDCNKNSDGDVFIMRSHDAAADIKKDCIELGMDVEVK